ncbi:MAG: NAD(P)-binding domain-containing protein, partial [Methylibium sp.]|nr:NAD(P)-binding domain-containing protein [Methylibium sp.]
MKLALLGTGLMGAPMTRRLCAAGLDVTVWNRTRAKAEALVPDGARVADTPDAAVQAADLTITMLEHG